MYCGTMGTPRKHKIGGSTAFLARPRLGALKNIYSSAKGGYSKPLTSCGFDKKKKVKKPSMPKMEYRKKPDYADTAYREAVSRLRILLAESYTPIKRPIRELDSAGEETDNQSLISGVSRVSRYPHYHNTALIRKYPYYPAKSVSHYANDDKGDQNKTDAPPELMTFIERQEDYIEQLERESRFCRDELSALLGKVKDVISENECLHEKQKNNLMKSVFDQFETETETETDLELAKNKSPRGTRKKVLEGPAIVFESRISELEAQLTQTKIDLKKAQEENDNLRKKIGDGTTSEGFDANRKHLESLQRDKVILQETVSKLQAALNLLRDKEHNTTDQVKRSLDVAEQAQYEKSAAEHEIRRLKDELERQHGKLRDAISEQSRRVADERAAVERRYSQQIEQLTAELGVHWEQSSKFQLEVDKQRRENADLRRELAQKQALIDELKKDMQNKIITLQSDIGVSGAEKSALEQQISNLQMANERCERQGKQEASRLHAEMQSLRQRLDRADADLIHSRRENIRLTEQIAGLEKEINMNAALADEKSKRQAGDIIALPPPKEPKEEMSAMIQDMEAKHVATVAELEGMIQSQNQLMDKLSSECHALTQKLEESSTRHKKLRADNDELVCKLEHVWASLKRLQNAKLREEIRELQTNLDYLTSRFSQSQIKPTIDKDESYTPAQHQPAVIEEPAPILSSTSSKSSIQPHPAVEAPPKIIQPEPPEQYYTKTEDSNLSNDNEAPNERKNVDPKQQYYKNPNEGKIKDPINNSNSGRIGDPNQQQYYKSPDNEKSVEPNQQQYYKNPDDGKNIDPNQQQYYTNPVEGKVSTDQNQPGYVTDQNQPQYYNPEEQKLNDPNQYEQPNQDYTQPQEYGYDDQQYTDQQYDPNQEYMTQEQYDEQYANYDPNAQYVEGDAPTYETDPQYQTEPTPPPPAAPK